MPTFTVSKTGSTNHTRPQNEYIDYLNTTFSDQASYHHFYLRFPTLGRWLAQVTHFLADNAKKLIERLHDDAEEISAAFFGQKIVKIRSLKPAKSDHHVNGQRVMFVEVELADSKRDTFVYKPRCLRSEVALQGILARLARDGVLNFATYQVLSKENYGYAILIPPGKNHVKSREEAERIYEELGGYLGLFHILGGSDLHFENLGIANGHAFIYDGETTLGMLPIGQSRSVDTVRDSVYRTGLLEWPRPPTTDALVSIKVSGYSGGAPFQSILARPKISASNFSFGLSVKHETGLQIEPDAANRICLNGQLIQPEDFKDSILHGFNRVYKWFQQEASAAIQCVGELFADASIRFVSQSTQVYAQLLLSMQYPKCLMEPLEVDLVVNSLREHRRPWDLHSLMAECERSSLWKLDIPIFTAHARRPDLLHDYRTELPMTLEITPLDSAIERISHLSSDDRLRQLHYITASLSAGEAQSVSFITSALDHAQQIGWQLCHLLRAPSEHIPWKSYQMTSAGIREVDISTDLYNGTAGIALFLAYLDAITPQQEFRHGAQRALSHAIASRENERIGVFQGLSGLIYVLTHLYHLWNDSHLLDLAVELSHEVSSQLENERNFDVFNGAAGIIPVMLGLAKATSGVGMDCAHRCAQHLLQHADRQISGLSWCTTGPEDATANLTGFSHGAAGIGWALISLGCVTQRSDYIAAGRQAFLYETTYFDESEQDWYDLRTNGVAANQHGHHFANAWCNGAAGIGLSRISSWAMLGQQDDDLLREASRALAATLRNFHKLGNDTLCHGRAGNAELFLRFAKLKDEPAYQMEANVQAQAQWRNFEQTRGWIFGGIGTKVFPGLMIGLAGLGIHFLRLVHSELVPSPLLLDAPRHHSHTKITANKNQLNSSNATIKV